MGLSDAVVAWIHEVGPTKARNALIDPDTGKRPSMTTIMRWKQRQFHPPIWVGDHILGLQDSKHSVPDRPITWEGERLRIAVPTLRGISSRTMKCIMSIFHRRPGKVSIDTEENTLIHLARNNLAKRFLDSEAEWLLFIDDDMVPPIGDAGQMKQWGMDVHPSFMATDVVSRLVGHKRTLVSGLYFDRHGKGIPMYAEGRNDERERNYARGGPYNTVKPTAWTGAGCLLVNRKVFDDIKDKLGAEVAPITGSTYRFFDPMPGTGEDVAFCKRAKEAGHQPHVDLGCLVGHIGEKIYWHK
jgi:hypothetical protein